MAASRTVRALAVLSVAGLTAVAPAAGNGAGQPHAVPGVLFPDCHLCPAPRPEPRQAGRLVNAPTGYTPGARYDLALEVTPLRGQVSRFALTASAGALEAGDGNTRVVNFSQLPNSSSLPGVQDFAMVTYIRPVTGPGATWRFRWSAPPSGAGRVNFAFYTMSGPGEVQKDAWRLQQVTIPEASAPSALPSAPPLGPAFPSPPAPPPPTAPPPETPRPSPGFELLAALAALGLGWVAAGPGRRR